MAPATHNPAPVTDANIFPSTVRAVFGLTRGSFPETTLKGPDAQANWDLLAGLFDRFGPGRHDPQDIHNGGILGMLALLRPPGVHEPAPGLLLRLINAGADPWIAIHKGKEHWRNKASGLVALRIIESGDMAATFACLEHRHFPGWNSLAPQHVRMLVEYADPGRIRKLVAMGAADRLAQYAPASCRDDTPILAIKNPDALHAWLSEAADRKLLGPMLQEEHAKRIAKSLHGTGKREQVLRRHCMENILLPGVADVVAHMAMAALLRGDRRNYGAWCGVGREFRQVSTTVLDHLQHASAGGLRDTIKMVCNRTIKHEPQDLRVMLRASLARGVMMLREGKMLWREGDAMGKWLLSQVRNVIEGEGAKGLGSFVEQAGLGAEPIDTRTHRPVSIAWVALALMGRVGFPGGAMALSQDSKQARQRVDQLLEGEATEVLDLIAFYAATGIEQAIEADFSGVLPNSLMKPLPGSKPSPERIRMCVMQLRCAEIMGQFDEELTGKWEEIAQQIDFATAMDNDTRKNARRLVNWRSHMEQSQLRQHVDPVAATSRPGPRF